jgi:hypothetical protein
MNLTREPRIDWRYPARTAPGSSSEARAANKAHGGLLVDPRSQSSTVSTAQDLIDRNRKSEVVNRSFMLSWTSSLMSATRYMFEVAHALESRYPVRGTSRRVRNDRNRALGRRKEVWRSWERLGGDHCVLVQVAGGHK